MIRDNRKKNKGKASFIFEVDSELNNLIVDYLNGEGNCEPLLYANSIKNLNNENFDYTTINKDCKLHYNSVNNRFTLLIPYEEKCKQLNNKKRNIFLIDDLKLDGMVVAGLSDGKDLW